MAAVEHTDLVATAGHKDSAVSKDFAKDKRLARCKVYQLTAAVVDKDLAGDKASPQAVAVNT